MHSPAALNGNFFKKDVYNLAPGELSILLTKEMPVKLKFHFITLTLPAILESLPLQWDFSRTG